MKFTKRFRSAFALPLTLLAIMAIALAGSLSVATAGADVTTASNSSSSAAPTEKPTVVLVHGAWADASGWAEVTASLQQKGYTVLSPPNALRGLDSDAARLASFLEAATEGPVILVGHSYGGAVITNAARSDEDVKALVFVNAFAPAKGESVLQLLDPEHKLDPTTLFNFVPAPSGASKAVELYLKQEVFPSAFANGVGAEQVAVLASAQRGITLRALEGASGRPAWKKLPSFYLVGTDDHIIPADLQRMMAERADATLVEVAAGHLSMITEPDAVTSLIVTAAK